MSMISELINDLSSLQTELQLLDMASRVNVIERAKVCIKMQSEKLQEQNLNGGWISCESQLPKEDGYYLCSCFYNDRYVRVFSYQDGRWLSPATLTDEVNVYVQAWKPLPEPWKGD